MFLDKRSWSILAAALLAAVPSSLFAQTAPASGGARDLSREVACGAQVAFTPPVASVTVAGGEDRGKELFATGDALVLRGGTSQGLRVGQEFFVRRVVVDRFAQPMSGGIHPLTVHTTGWIRVVDVQASSAIATVTHACDAVTEGDYLEAFSMPVVPAPIVASGEPDYANAGHLVLGDERRQMGGAGSLMVIDRGSDHGVHSGQRATIFRENRGAGAPVFRVGEAWIVSVSPETSLVRIESSRDAVYVGDRVAFHR